MKVYKKVILILFIYVILQDGFGMSLLRRNPPPKQLPEVVVTPENSAPSSSVKLFANIRGEMRDASKIERLQKLIPLAEKVLNSPQLEKRMLAAWYNGKPGFQDTEDTPEQALAKLKASDWLLVYEFGNNQRSVTGWTYPNTQTVWFNRKNFDNRSDCGIVGTIHHEKSHKLGYSHKNSKRYLSLPYYLGTQAAQVCEEFQRESSALLR